MIVTLPAFARVGKYYDIEYYGYTRTAKYPSGRCGIVYDGRDDAGFQVDKNSAI